MDIEEIKKERSSVTSMIFVSMLVLMGINECAYRYRVSVNEEDYKECMADEADDIFVNYSNCNIYKNNIPKP